jgi:serine protease
VAVAVSGGTPPTTSITAPAAGSTVSGTVTVTATATDSVGVTKIELYVDGALLASGTASPFSAPWNTAGVANGAHSLTSKAYNAAGGVGTSSAVSVTVSNGAVTNPVINPGFETGTLSGWTASGTARASPYPHTGSYACSLGSSSPTTDSSVSQTFTMPAGATTLSVWVRVFCHDTISYDWANAMLHDNVTGATITVLPNTCTLTNTWVQASANVSSTAGHSVTLKLLNHDDNYAGDATYTDFDDISVQ